MELPTWFSEITSVLGIGSLSTIVIFIFGKYLIMPLWSRYLDYKLASDQAKIQSNYTIVELREQATLEAKNQFSQNRLEFEVVKIDRALPHLENLNALFTKFIMMYNNYLKAIINKGSISSSFDSERAELDKEVIEIIYRVGIYLPKEMNVVLRRLRVIMSNSFKDPKILYNIITQDRLNKLEVAEKTTDILSNYLNCYQEMAYNYCKVNEEEIKLSEIMVNNNIAEDGYVLNKEFIQRYSIAYILMHEYTNQEEYGELKELVEKNF